MSKLTNVQIELLKALEEMPDSEINISDIPEITNWNNDVVGKFYQSIKKPVTIGLDTDA